MAGELPAMLAWAMLAQLLLWSGLPVAAGQPAAPAPAVAMLVDPGLGFNATLVRGLASRLHACGCALTNITGSQMASTKVLNRTAFDWLVLPDATKLPAAAASSYLAFAAAGGGLVVLGGRPPRLNVSRQFALINVMSPYEPYQLDGTSVDLMHVTAAGQKLVGMRTEPTPGEVTGLSAIGWHYNGSGTACTFTPLLELSNGPVGNGTANRTRGWALSIMHHDAGGFAGGSWLLSGLTGPTALSPLLLDTVAAAVGSRELASLARGPPATGGGAPARLPSILALPSTAPGAGITDGFVRLSADKRHLVYPDGTRFFAVGGDYYRGDWTDSVTPGQLRVDLENAARAGYTLVRVYGFSPEVLTGPEFLAVYRDMLARYGLRLLVVTACFKDPQQDTKSGVVSNTTALAKALANETWLLGYDLCNEPDNSPGFPGNIRIDDRGDGSKTLADLHPNMSRWGAFVTWQCQGWSSTYGDACGNITAPVLPTVPADLLPVFTDMNAAFGTWLGWKASAVRAVAQHHLVTVGNNALRGLLPANALADFVAHHAYPSNPSGADSLYYASPMDVAELATTSTRLQGIWSHSPRPVLLGEFGTRTTDGLAALYQPALPVRLPEARGTVLPTATLQEGRGEHPRPAAPAGHHSVRGPVPCALPQDCLAGVASTINWYLTHGMRVCWKAWEAGVAGNAGPNSTHHRCPASAGTGVAAWDDPQYTACRAEIIAAARAANESTCVPEGPHPTVSLDFQSAAAWDVLVWAQALVDGTSGALMWALAEKPYVLSTLADAYIGDDRLATPHDKYVSGSRFGLFFYDGVLGGRPKPVALAARFLNDYLKCRPAVPGTGNATAFALVTFAQHAGVLPIGYSLAGPDLLLVAAANFTSAELAFAVPGGGASLVMTESHSCRCPSPAARTRVMATADSLRVLVQGAPLTLLAGEPVCV